MQAQDTKAAVLATKYNLETRNEIFCKYNYTK